jgi:hypothetical protein
MGIFSYFSLFYHFFLSKSQLLVVGRTLPLFLVFLLLILIIRGFVRECSTTSNVLPPISDPCSIYPKTLDTSDISRRSCNISLVLYHWIYTR